MTGPLTIVCMQDIAVDGWALTMLSRANVGCAPNARLLLSLL